MQQDSESKIGLRSAVSRAFWSLPGGAALGQQSTLLRASRDGLFTSWDRACPTAVQKQGLRKNTLMQRRQRRESGWQGPGWAGEVRTWRGEGAWVWADTAWRTDRFSEILANALRAHAPGRPGDSVLQKQAPRPGQRRLSWCRAPQPGPPLLKAVWPTRSLLIVPVTGLPAAPTD